MMGSAGIAAEKYSHVKYFPNRAAYDDYYDIAVDIGEVGVESFATRIQEMLVDYLRDKHGDKVADWCRDFWTGERGRMCLAHSRYAGCNNNMGVEVSWRQIKRVCPSLASLAEFIGALCKFIRRQLGEEHRDRLRKEGDSNAFIRYPTATKSMYDAVQDVHPKTLSACFVMLTTTSKTNPEELFRDMVRSVMESGTAKSPLHLKIVAYHDDRLREGATLPLELLELKQVLMPRQWFLKQLDPKGELSVPELRDLLRPHMLEYRALILLDHVEPGMTVKKALSIYRKWHVMNRTPTWGAVPFSCSCKVCFAHCICRETILLASLFDPEVRVPADLITATVSTRARNIAIGGTAGRKRRRLEEERACNEKAIDSKVKYLRASAAPPRELVVPAAEGVVMPSSDDDFEVWPLVIAHGVHV
jgi:hypothetical protein